MTVPRCRPSGNQRLIWPKTKSETKRWTSNLIGTQDLCLLESTSVPHPITSPPTPSLSHLPPPLSHFTCFSYTKHVSGRRSTVQNYPPSPRLFAPHRSTSNSSSISDGSKGPPFINQPRPNLTSRSPRNLHTDAHHVYHFRGLRFSNRWLVPFVSCLFMGSER